MFKGTILMTTDEVMINTAVMSGCEIVCMKENLESGLYIGKDPTFATILLPPLEALSIFLDGNDLVAKNMYFDHLATKECDMYICALMAAAIKGMNLVIYLDQAMYEMKFAFWFQEFINMKYGVMIASEYNGFGFNPSQFGVILSNLYLYDLVDVESFFLLYPYELPLEPYIIQRILVDFNPFPVPQTFEVYYAYFNDYKNSVKRYNKPLSVPFVITEAPKNET